MDMKDDELRISLKFLTGELMKVYTGTIFVDDVEKLCEELKGVKYEHDLVVEVHPVIAGFIFETVSVTNIIAEYLDDECKLDIRASRYDSKVDLQYDHFMNRFDFFVRDMKHRAMINRIHNAFKYACTATRGSKSKIAFIPEPYRSILNVCSISLNYADITSTPDGIVSVDIKEMDRGQASMRAEPTYLKLKDEFAGDPSKPVKIQAYDLPYITPWLFEEGNE